MQVNMQIFNLHIWHIGFHKVMPGKRQNPIIKGMYHVLFTAKEEEIAYLEKCISHAKYANSLHWLQ